MMAAASKRQSLNSNSQVDKLDSKPEKNMQVNQEKEMDLSALKAVRGGLKQEVENLSIARQAPRLSEIGVDESRWVVSSNVKSPVLVYLSWLTPLMKAVSVHSTGEGSCLYIFRFQLYSP